MIHLVNLITFIFSLVLLYTRLYVTTRDTFVLVHITLMPLVSFYLYYSTSIQGDKAAITGPLVFLVVASLSLFFDPF